MTGPTASTPAAPTAAASTRVFVARRGNGFMADLAAMLVDAIGPGARLVHDDLPANDGVLNLVVAPHEFFELFEAPAKALRAAAAASVCIGTEQPGTPWFELTVDAATIAVATLDINANGVAALRARGIPATRLALGAVDSLIAPDAARRDVDVLFLGGLDDRRGRLLAETAASLEPLRCDLRLFRFDRPVGATTPGIVLGRAKYDLLARSRILLNLHRGHGDDDHGRPGYFEWVRMIEAMANGCVVVTEPSTGHEPLVAGVHFVDAADDAIGDAVAALAADEARRSQLATDAFTAVHDTLSLRSTMSRLVEELRATTLPRIDQHVAAQARRRTRWGFHGETSNPVRRLGPMQPFAGVQRTAKRLALADGQTIRRIDALRCVLAHGAEQRMQRIVTPAYEEALPDVTVIVTLYNYANVVVETLDSIARSTGVSFEVVVIDDHSTDDGRAVVTDWMATRADVPALLVGKDANAGLASARNTGFDVARAPFVMVMDADNMIYPSALRRLRDTLLDHVDAAAAYAILEDFGEQRHLRSALEWDPVRLCEANYIDAQAMWRLTSWWELGGYRSDEDGVYGWEDWDLWLRLADRGGHAVLHREILGRYRVRTGSMISLTNLETDEAITAIRGRYPSLPWTSGEGPHR
jgi:hypothetical protein